MFVFWMNDTCASTCNTLASHNCHSSTWLQLPPNPGHIKKNKSKPMISGKYQIYQPGPTHPENNISPGSLEIPNLETHPFLGAKMLLVFRECIGKKPPKKGGTSKNQNLPAIGPKLRLSEVQTIQVEVWCCHLGR